MMTRCPINKEKNIRCGCHERSFRSFSGACAVCDVAGHDPDSVNISIAVRASSQWS